MPPSLELIAFYRLIGFGALEAKYHSMVSFETIDSIFMVLQSLVVTMEFSEFGMEFEARILSIGAVFLTRPRLCNKN